MAGRFETNVFQRAFAANPPEASLDRVKDLVARYPHISGAEAAEILKYVRQARYAEMELLASDAAVREQLTRFLKSHGDELRYSPAEIVTIIALVVAFLSICWVLWHPIGGL